MAEKTPLDKEITGRIPTEQGGYRLPNNNKNIMTPSNVPQQPSSPVRGSLADMNRSNREFWKSGK